MNAIELRKLQGEVSVLREKIGDGTNGGLAMWKNVSRARRLLILVEESLSDAAECAAHIPVDAGRP